MSAAGLGAVLAGLGAPWAEAVGPAAHALWPWLGARGPVLARGRGAPVGLDGIGRRGAWERLVHTEWALLDAAPEAFLQRAVDGELAFFARAEEAPGPPRRVVAWVDLGPDSLGAPRVVLAAGLVVLAARAAALGVPLEWGVLGEDGLQTGLDAAALDGLRARRRWVAAAVPVGAAAAGVGPADEGVLLLAGGPLRVPGLQVVRAAPRGDGVELHLDGRPVAVPAVEPGAGRAALRGAAAGPGAPGAWRDDPVAPGGFFSPSGARLLVWTADGRRALAVPVAGGGAPRQVHRHEVSRVRGLGWRDGGMVVLEVPPEPGPVDLWHKGRTVRWDAPAVWAALDALPGPGLLVRDPGGGFLLLPPPDRLLFSVGAGGGLALHGADGEAWPLDGAWRFGWDSAALPGPAAVGAEAPRVLWVQEDGLAHAARVEGGGLRLAPAPPGMERIGAGPLRLLPQRHGALVLALDPAVAGASAAGAAALWWANPGAVDAGLRRVPGWVGGLVFDVGRGGLLTREGDRVLRVDRSGETRVRAEGAVHLAVAPTGAAWAWVDGAGRLALVAEPGGAVVQRLGPA